MTTTCITTRIQWLLLVTILLSHASFCLVEAFMGRAKEQPVKLRIHKKASQKVKTLISPKDKDDEDSNWLLQEYMQLPAAQYACVPLPIKASLDRVYGKADEFTLQVPTMQFPISTKSGEIEITPKVRALVTVQPDKVVIQSLSCEIDGSPAVQEWKLNERYELDVCATLTWEKGSSDGVLGNISDGAQSKGSLDFTEASYQPHPTSLESSTESESSSLSSSSNNSFQEDVICIQTDLAIDVYPPPIKRIQMIPKRLLTKIGNMVLKYVLGLLLEAFLEGLQQDYEQWASCPDYRAERQKLEQELQLELRQLEVERKKQAARELRQKRQQERRQRNANRLEDDSSPNAGGRAFSFQTFHVGFLQPRQRRNVATAATASTATLNRNKLRRGERIIRLIRRNNHQSSV